MSGGIRLSIDEALARGFITPETAASMRQKPKSARKRTSPGRSKAKGPKSTPVAYCDIDGDTPQQRLWRALVAAYPGQCAWEASGIIPGRRFLVDIAFPEQRLAVEVDGWKAHAVIKSGFERDREKGRLLRAAGWMIIHVSAKQVLDDLDGTVTDVGNALRILTRNTQDLFS